ncbi:class I SAM-dependent methyltransferase [Kallotenue papyrolyticum]|uniref:class I SAM-dependent methyltransferase n=1 Tax=Kallotenue papyrolyticum TaxID=1325125 RepID=UPI0004785AB1|nr:class I SAM-dependent methyltransferase [Kallotenue papyrolyticum]
MQRLLDRVSQTPRLWNALRWLAEAGFHGEHRVIAHELQPWRDTQRRFLDWGCGTGQFAADFPAERYVGIDLTRPYVRYAAQARPGQFSVMDGSCLGLADASFDAALVLGVLHHLPDAVVRAGIAELHRVLRPAGTVLVIEDVPPPTLWNLPGHLMHWLDRGEHIRADADYRALFAPYFGVRRAYHMRSGICDYGVYVLERQALDGSA